jgi:hypothetical protein
MISSSAAADRAAPQVLGAGPQVGELVPTELDRDVAERLGGHVLVIHLPLGHTSRREEWSEDLIGDNPKF